MYLCFVGFDCFAFRALMFILSRTWFDDCLLLCFVIWLFFGDFWCFGVCWFSGYVVRCYKLYGFLNEVVLYACVMVVCLGVVLIGA